MLEELRRQYNDERGTSLSSPSSPLSTLLPSISASVCYLAYFILDKTILLSDTLAAKDEEMRKLTFTIKFQSTLQDKITAVCILILFYFFDIDIDFDFDFDFDFYLSLYFYFYFHTNFFFSYNNTLTKWSKN